VEDRDGSKDIFWKHLWVGDVSLEEKFRRLFLNLKQKDSFLSDVGFWDGGVGGGTLNEGDNGSNGSFLWCSIFWRARKVSRCASM